MFYSFIFHLFFIFFLFLVSYICLKFYHRNKMLRTVIAFLIANKSLKSSYGRSLWLLHKENIERELSQCLNVSCLIERPEKEFELPLYFLLKLLYTDKGYFLFENKMQTLSFFKNSKVKKGGNFLKFVWNSENKVWVLLS